MVLLLLGMIQIQDLAQISVWRGRCLFGWHSRKVKARLAAFVSDDPFVSDLFKVAMYLKDNKDAKFATKCRKAILNAFGLVNFPDTPEQEQQIIGIDEKVGTT